MSYPITWEFALTRVYNQTGLIFVSIPKLPDPWMKCILCQNTFHFYDGHICEKSI